MERSFGMHLDKILTVQENNCELGCANIKEWNRKIGI